MNNLVVESHSFCRGYDRPCFKRDVTELLDFNGNNDILSYLT